VSPILHTKGIRLFRDAGKQHGLRITEPAIVGAAAIGAFLAAACGGGGRLVATARSANGRPAVAMRERTGDGTTRPHRLLVLDVEGDGIARLRAYGDPELLAAFGV
jgi:hypothetical protein